MPRRRDLICMMAKAPVAGQVKTRLCPPLTPAQAAELSAAFIRDTWCVVTGLDDTRSAIAYAGDPTLLPIDCDQDDRWRQTDGDLGARIEAVVQRGLASAERVVVIGSDAPGLPRHLIEQARIALRTDDAVLGPAMDGGYYLIGMRRCESGLFANLPWSASDTLSATHSRMTERGYSVALLSPWFDVDDHDDLALLRQAIGARAVDAPATARALEQIP